MKAFGLFSNFNFVPDEVLFYDLEDFLIFDQSNDPIIQSTLEDRFGNKVIRSQHCGHNLSDYLRYIADNYSKLPENLLLGKGNMVPRHLTLDDYRSKTSMSSTADPTPMYSTSYVKEKKGVATLTPTGWFNERNNDWYVNLKRHRYFSSVDNLGDFLFSNWPRPRHISFSPGACYLVSGSQLRKNPRETYVCLQKVLEYDFFPSEAWMIERIFGPLLRAELKLRPEWLNTDEFVAALNSLPDLTELKVSGAGPLNGIKNLVYSASFKMKSR